MASASRSPVRPSPDLTCAPHRRTTIGCCRPTCRPKGRNGCRSPTRRASRRTLPRRRGEGRGNPAGASSGPNAERRARAGAQRQRSPDGDLAQRDALLQQPDDRIDRSCSQPEPHGPETVAGEFGGGTGRLVEKATAQGQLGRFRAGQPFGPVVDIAGDATPDRRDARASRQSARRPNSTTCCIRSAGRG